MEKLKYLWVLSMSEGRMMREIDGRIGAASAVIRTLKLSVVLQRELIPNAKLSIDRSIYNPSSHQ